MDIDIATLVRESLRAGGCDASLLNNFDGHSTILLDFDGLSGILISVVDKQVVLWSQLCDYNRHVLSQVADRVLELLMEPVKYSVTGQLQIAREENVTVLKCVLEQDCLNEAMFGDALETFYLSLQKYCEVLR
ncbi:hypothetical protein J2125_002020 [Erwinia toletana]|uniref:Uncharacterized protein n=1 Tax=Winslowiella toletana TaxID=92490 RepID=A0ABS4P859_9GAMM|nr:hypothetical protein [Winslowiella toletana]MBP2168828.1 hypothetical protein [Winslowiella toletana]